MTGLDGLSVIGYFCWWSLNSVKIKRETMQQLLDDAGIDFKVPEIKARSAFLKATREVRSQYKNKGILIRKISKSSSMYVFGLVDETVTARDKSLNYNHKASMKFSPEFGTLRTDTPHKGFDLIEDLYETYKDYMNADDVREIIMQALCSVLSLGLRPRGGIYYVHATHVDMVEKLEKLVSQIPGDNAFMAVPQIDTESSKRAIYKAFAESLKTRIKGFNQDLDAQGGLKQKHALTQRLAEFKTVRKEIEFYRDALQFQVDDLSTALVGLTEKVKSKLLAA